MLAVHQIKVLRLGVERLKIVVGDRPRRRDPTMVAKFAEVLRAEPEQRRAVELGVPAHVVVDFRLELIAVPVVPELLREVLPAYEHRVGLPVVALPRQERPPLQPEHLHPVRGEPVPEGSSPGSRTDDHNVVVLVGCHAGSLLESGFSGTLPPRRLGTSRCTAPKLTSSPALGDRHRSRAESPARGDDAIVSRCLTAEQGLGRVQRGGPWRDPKPVESLTPRRQR
jgi:hypothetical protein